MPVERYKVGRKYTERQRIYIPGDALGTEEGVAALAESFRDMAKGATLEGRLTDTVQWAAATLERAGMPLDQNAPIYADKEWRRQNERKSAAWYAITILETAGWLRTFRERGDMDLALGVALDLGVLATEARFAFGYMSRKATGMAHGKASKARKKAAEDRERWDCEATKIWKKRPLLSITAVAGRIDSARVRTVRRHIAHLKPDAPIR